MHEVLNPIFGVLNLNIAVPDYRFEVVESKFAVFRIVCHYFKIAVCLQACAFFFCFKIQKIASSGS